MSTLFNLSNVFSEDTSMLSDIVSQYIPRTYLSEAVSILRVQDKVNIQSLDTLYSALHEAESKAEENSKFADYFKEYQKTVEQYIMKMKQMTSEFAISVENFADANRDVLDTPDNANILAVPSYTGVKYTGLLDTDVPDIEPYKAFKKEFAFIGKLLQDLGPDVKEEVKAQVIASVCNSLSKEINDGWIDKVAEKIADCDECDKDGFARTMYNKFVKNPSEEMKVDVGLVKQAKLSIMNYNQYINVIEKAANDFCDGMEKVAEEIGSMFFRNKDHKLPIKTDQDGVEDRTYRLGDYSMNQVNMFISTKISQTNEICNLYLIALSIKMDCIIKYLQQCKDIINTACAGVDNTPNNKIDPGDNDVDNNGAPENDDVPEVPESTENDEPDDTEDDIPEDDDEPDGIEPDDKGAEDSDDQPVEDGSLDQVEQECYLFEANVLEYERYLNYHMLRETYIGEAIDPNKAKAAIGGKINGIIQKILKIIESVKNALKLNYQPIIDAVGKNRSKILTAKVPNGWTMQKIESDPLTKFTLKAYSTGQDCSDAAKYLTSTYPEICAMPNGKESASAKELILAKLYKEQEDGYTQQDFAKSVDFIAKQYTEIIGKCEAATKSLNSQKNTISKNSVSDTDDQGGDDKQEGKNESAFVSDIMKTYFTEDNTPGTIEKSDEAKKADGGSDYAVISSNLITAIINVNNMCFKKHLAFVRKLAASVNVQIPMPKVGEDKNKNQQQDNNAQ